jgi:hypothetical protein
MASALSRCYNSEDAQRNMDIDTSIAHSEGDRPSMVGENFTFGASEAKRRGISRTQSAPLRNITNNYSSASGSKKIVGQRPPKPVPGVTAKRPLPSHTTTTTGWAPNVTPQSIEESENIQLVSEYAADIHSFLLSEESIRLPSATYMEQQRDINSRMRAILIDWLVEVHSKYRLHDETLWLAAQVVDRYLQTSQVMRNRLQLVGVAAMLIAAKFEEIHPPEVRDFAYITDNTYSKQEILDMEAVILNVLAFDIACPTVVHFLAKFQRANRGSEVHKHLAQYIAELSLLEMKFLKYKPSQIAAAAVLLSNRLMLRRAPTQTIWGQHMVLLTQCDEQELEACVQDLRVLYEAQSSSAPTGNPTNGPLNAVKKKFQSAKYNTVSCLALA